ncbi:acetyltransferase [Achromobacter xylosoxidans]
MRDLPVIIVGGGGHGRVLVDALQAAGRHVLGFTDNDPAAWGTTRCGAPVLGNDDVLRQHEPQSVLLANGLGTTRVSTLRRDVFLKLKAQGYRFTTIVHPSATISPHASIEEGCQIMARAVIQPGTAVAANTIINTGAIVDHDCSIGAHTHVATGATLSGGVTVGENCHIGAGATVIQGVSLGDHCLIAAGAIVVRNAATRSRLAGVPARPMEKT